MVLWCNCRRHPLPPPDELLGYNFVPAQAYPDTAFVGGRAARTVILLRNYSENPLTLTTLEGDCPSTLTWAISNSTIDGGSASNLVFSFSPTQAYGETWCTVNPRFEGQSSAGTTKLDIKYAAGEAACALSPQGPFEFAAVDVGSSADHTLTISNVTSEEITANQFEYVFQNPSSDCSLFLMEEVDATGVLGPGIPKEITVRFQPNAVGTFECQRELVSRSLAGIPGHPNITNSCPSVVAWKATAISQTEPVCGLSPSANLQFDEVQVGASKELTLTILNQTTNEIPANQFGFLLDNPAGDCDLFTIDPADTEGVIGPGGSKDPSRDIVVRFAPLAEGSFKCTRTLSSLKEPPDPLNPILNYPCRTEVVWEGTGKIGPPMWSACLPGGSQDLHAIFGIPGGEVYVVGDGGSLATSGGDCQWSTSVPGTDVDLRDVWAYTNGTEKAIWAVGKIPPPLGLFQETGAILMSDGGSWTKVDEDSWFTYASVWGSGPDDVYFAGAGIATDFPNAKHWNGSTLGPLQISDMGMSMVTGLSGTAGNDVWAVLGQVYQSIFRFQGTQWDTQTQTFMAQPLYDVWAVQGTEFYAVYAVGGDGAIYHYDGQGWTDESISGETRDFYGVWVSQTGQVFVVGEDQAIYRGHVNDPTGWAVQSIPTGLPAGDLMDVWGASDDTVFTVGTNGVILRYGPEG